MRTQFAACGKFSSDELDEAPTVLVLAAPEAPEAFSDQFGRFYRESPMLH